MAKSSAHDQAKYKVQPAITAKNKERRQKARGARKERWATDKEYLKKQEVNGYEKIEGKWVKTRWEKANV